MCVKNSLGRARLPQQETAQRKHCGLPSARDSPLGLSKRSGKIKFKDNKDYRRYRGSKMLCASDVHIILYVNSQYCYLF